MFVKLAYSRVIRKRLTGNNQQSQQKVRSLGLFNEFVIFAGNVLRDILGFVVWLTGDVYLLRGIFVGYVASFFVIYCC